MATHPLVSVVLALMISLYGSGLMSRLTQVLPWGRKSLLTARAMHLLCGISLINVVSIIEFGATGLTVIFGVIPSKLTWVRERLLPISHRLQPIAVAEPWLCGIKPMAPKAAFGRVSYLLCHPLRVMERKRKLAVPSRQRATIVKIVVLFSTLLSL